MDKEAVKYVDVTPLESELSADVNNHVTCDVPGCGQMFTSGGSFLFHKAKTHPSAEHTQPDYLMKKDKNVVFRFYCPVSGCKYNPTSGKHFTNRKYLKQHYGKIHREKKFMCGSCDKGFPYDRDLKRHTATCGVEFKCVTCDCPYTTPEAVLTHCKRHQHVAPESAKSSKRGLKHQAKNPKSTTGSHQPSTSLHNQPQIVIINNTSQPITLPDSTKHATTTNVNEQIAKLPKLLPKCEYSSSVVVFGQTSRNPSGALQTVLPKTSPPKIKTVPSATQNNPQKEITPLFGPNNYISNHQTGASVQTDIYGLENLVLSSGSAVSTGTQADATASSLTQTTGMQTSMSFIPTKKKTCTITGTQTSAVNTLGKIMKTAKVQTPNQTRRNLKKCKRTSEVQTSTSFCSKKKKLKRSEPVSEHVSVGCDPAPPFLHLSLDDLSTNWTQTNLSYFNQATGLFQNIETQTQSSFMDDLPGALESDHPKQLLQFNLDLLANATLTNFLPNALSELDQSTVHKRYTLGDPALGVAFSNSMDSESQTVTTASDLDLLLQPEGQSVTLTTGTGTDNQTQTVEEELLEFLMNNMETQTTEELFPDFGLSDIETQTCVMNPIPVTRTEVCLQTDQIHLYSPCNNVATGSQSIGTCPDELSLLDSSVTTETQTNFDFLESEDFTMLTDMQTQTTFNTVDFFTNLTDSHTQTSFL